MALTKTSVYSSLFKGRATGLLSVLNTYNGQTDYICQKPNQTFKLCNW